MISILLSCFEYFLSSKLVQFGSDIIISFCIESKQITSMPHKAFQSNIVFRKSKVTRSVAKLLNVRVEQVERLKPKKALIGAIFSFIVVLDAREYHNVKQRAEQMTQDQILVKVL